MNHIDLLHTLIQRLSIVLMWTVFAVLHLFLLVVGLFALWISQVDPTVFAEKTAALYHRANLPTVFAVLGILGVSASTMAVVYVRLWKKMYSWLLVPFLFKDADREN